MDFIIYIIVIAQTILIALPVLQRGIGSALSLF